MSLKPLKPSTNTFLSHFFVLTHNPLLAILLYLKSKFLSKGNTGRFGSRESQGIKAYYCFETFEKCSILFKFKEGENFNRRNTLSILRIKI
jgi:hypothetical protein